MVPQEEQEEVEEVVKEPSQPEEEVEELEVIPKGTDDNSKDEEKQEAERKPHMKDAK